MYEDLERFKIMRIIKKEGTLIHWDIMSSFGNLLNKEMGAIRTRIITDDTVDEDIIELQAVIKAVLKRVPKQMSEEKIFVYCEAMFNGLMTRKYGFPLPEDKKFHSRVKEFAQEVYTIEVDKAQFDIMKRMGRYAA